MPLENSIAYKGNGKFEVSDHNADINLGVWSEKALNLLLNYVSMGDDLVSLIKNFLPTSTVNFGLNLSLTMTGLSRVTFMDNGEIDKVMFLPNGLDPAKYYNPGEDFEFWVTEDGIRVDAINGDVELYAVRDFINGGKLTVDAEGNWTITSDSEAFTITINLEKAYLLKNAKTLTFANTKGLKIKMSE